MLVTQAMKKWSQFMSLYVTVGGSCATERNKHVRKWQSEQVTYKMASNTCYLNCCVNKWKLSGRNVGSRLCWFSYEGGTSLTCPPCRKCGKYTANIRRLIRGELSYLAPLGSQNISAPYFKQCFFRGGGYYPHQTESNTTPPSPQDRNNKYFILCIEFCITNKI